MKIKELFAQMEKANTFLEMVKEEKWHLEVTFDNDWWFGKSFDTFKDFQKWLKEEYTEIFWKATLEVEIEMDEQGNGKGTFATRYWWQETEEEHSILVHFYHQ